MRRNGAGAKNQYEVVEGVERPAEEAGNEGVALEGSEPAEVAEETYRRLRCCNGVDASTSAARATCAISLTS
jgi:hypothetical protein